MAKGKRTEIEKEIDRAYQVHGNGVQVPMMSLVSIYKAAARGEDIEEAVVIAIAQFRVN
jgi:hypothetical protein